MKTMVRISAWVSLMMSIILFFGLHFHVNCILQCFSSNWPVPYASVLCLFLSSLALFFIFSSYRWPISNILGCAIFLLGFQRTVELLLPANSKFNVLLFHNMTFFPMHFSRMTLMGAVGFTLVGIGFIFWQRNCKQKIRELLSLFMIVPIIFLGSVEIFTNILPLQINEEMRKFLMHFYTAIGLFLVGLGFLFAIFYRKKVNQNLPQH